MPLWQAAQQPDPTGALPLTIAFRVGASEPVKEALWEAWPGVAAAEGVLAEALKEKWGDAYVVRMVESAPEAPMTVPALLLALVLIGTHHG